MSIIIHESIKEHIIMLTLQMTKGIIPLIGIHVPNDVVTVPTKLINKKDSFKYTSTNALDKTVAI